MIHLYSFGRWLDIAKTYYKLEPREEFDKSYPINDTDMFGGQLSAKELFKQMAERQEDYDNRVAVNKIQREFDLGIDKMKG